MLDFRVTLVKGLRTMLFRPNSWPSRSTSGLGVPVIRMKPMRCVVRFWRRAASRSRPDIPGMCMSEITRCTGLAASLPRATRLSLSVTWFLIPISSSDCEISARLTDMSSTTITRRVS
jgi:hypothetical protein